MSGEGGGDAADGLATGGDTAESGPTGSGPTGHGAWGEDSAEPHATGHDATDHDESVPPDYSAAALDLSADPDSAVDVFPAAVDVGQLPEPVDGFPWIDSGSLGLADIAAAVEQAELDPVQPGELAEYAAAELAPGVDPWAELADSDDPATSNLARWWSQN
ncbi:hypothetical protein Ari01nite_62310 [Paractinoplanes rishiriensis]|uniref:Uncharacterized protein n=1 Tax=Paractinoplanes rishiriensis TaxID=1050105 RepID=A0A919MT08_9ACTN|nr:hypothetical protein Ari01nite_62310 [Actinoplanes rishiriensis]